MMRGICAIVGLIGLSACSGTIDVGAGRGGAPGSNAPGGAAGGSALGGAPGNNEQGGAPGSNEPSGTVGGGGVSDGDPVTCTNLNPLPEWPSTTACAGSNDFPLVGRWRGYTENHDDELFLDIRGANSEGLCGTLTVGSDPPPPPATDGREAYPPGWTTMEAITRHVIPGFPMTLLAGKTDGTRVRFQTAAAEGFKSWCALQPSYPRDTSGASCGCATDGTISRGSDECVISGPTGTRTLSCAQVDLCLVGTCTCNASGCDAAQSISGAYDLVVTGDTMQGGSVHFTRMP